MSIDSVPDLYLKRPVEDVDLYIYDFKMTEDVIKTKVNLNMHMFSFLQEGRKKVHIEDEAIAVNKDQSLLLKKGNCLWTELLDTEAIYFCRLLFFSDRRLNRFLDKYNITSDNIKPVGHFAIKNDDFIASYFEKLTNIFSDSEEKMETLLESKFEELVLYLIHKYGCKFKTFLLSLVSDQNSEFESIIENNTYSSLKIEEMAFLAKMSLSTFKRKFAATYHLSPGKWLRDKRLQRAKKLLSEGTHKSSDIYLDLGYNNLSNFSFAFKNKFGISPKEVRTSR